MITNKPCIEKSLGICFFLYRFFPCDMNDAYTTSTFNSRRFKLWFAFDHHGSFIYHRFMLLIDNSAWLG